MGPWHWGDGMGWWMLFGGLLWLAFWGSLIYLALALVRSRGEDREEPRSPDAAEIVRRRYARGEIDRDEYERLRKDLAA